MGYKKLFKERGILFNGKWYTKKESYFNTYCNIIKDILDGKHGEVNSILLNKSFGKSIRLEYEDLPKSVKETNRYRKLDDIYILCDKGEPGFRRKIEKVGKTMGKEVEIDWL